MGPAASQGIGEKDNASGSRPQDRNACRFVRLGCQANVNLQTPAGPGNPHVLLLSNVLFLTLVAIGAAASDATRNATQVTVAKKVIIEAGESTSIESLAKRVESTGAKILKTFDSHVFTGISVETDASADSLQAHDEVHSIWPIGRMQLDPIMPTRSFAHDAANYSVHEYTGVSKCHAAGLYGKGARVAIVDTGTNYHDEAVRSLTSNGRQLRTNKRKLGGGFGPGFKVTAGYDFVGDRDWPYTSKEPGSDFLDDELGHGTHVAGIVAGKSGWSVHSPWTQYPEYIYWRDHGLSNRIIASGAALPWSVEQPKGNPQPSGNWAPVGQVGAGMIDAWKVMSYTTSLGSSRMNLGDSFNFKYPEYDPAKLGMYSGKVLISGSNGEELSVPYLGVGADIHKHMQNSMFTDNVSYQYGGFNRDNIEYFHTYDFNLTCEAQNFPKIYLDLHYGTKELRWDVFEKGWDEKNWEYPPVLGQTPGYVGSVAYYAGLGSGGWGYDPTLYNDQNVTVPFPVPLSRGDSCAGKDSAFWWFGKLANGSYIAPGDYYWRIAALYPFGDPRQSTEWDIWNMNGVEYITVTPYAP
ncbi:Subtilisin DY [Apiospora saccharicola]